ncbi:DsbC family protein [uncultured Pseudoalteromonas sp.]|uniref:DsbC family protein n=1 Tax=uncultured Pseudoalteromonas sp. TaxID=114053 RepID=UPI00259367A0|nr:DsbC family protein [uncultured Pseudoalteromonas sp.]
MNFKKTLIALTLTLSFSAVAGTKINPAELKQSLTEQGELEGIQDLPIKDIMLVKTKTGQTYFVSKNGRFVFQGKLIDTWFRRTIDELGEARRAHRVPLDKMGVKIDELATFTFGNTDLPKQATVFVDPNCGYCAALFNRLAQSPEKYHMDFVLTPILGQQSIQDATRLHCAADRKKAMKDLMNKTKFATETVKDCDITAVNKGAIVLGLVEARGVPFLIREDGLTLGGLPSDIDAWLEME